MEEFLVKFVLWLAATAATLAVGAGFDLFAVTVASSIVVALIWSVIIFGGFLILDNLDDVF